MDGALDSEKSADGSSPSRGGLVDDDGLEKGVGPKRPGSGPTGSKTPVMAPKYRGSIVVLSISKSVEFNEEQKEMISGFQ